MEEEEQHLGGALGGLRGGGSLGGVMQEVVQCWGAHWEWRHCGNLWLGAAGGVGGVGGVIPISTGNRMGGEMGFRCISIGNGGRATGFLLLEAGVGGWGGRNRFITGE